MNTLISMLAAALTTPTGEIMRMSNAATVICERVGGPKSWVLKCNGDVTPKGTKIVIVPK